MMEAFSMTSTMISGPQSGNEGEGTKKARRRWAMLIQKVYQVDPLRSSFFVRLDVLETAGGVAESLHALHAHPIEQAEVEVC